MSIKCNHCINKAQCAECDKDWKDKFIPSNEVKQFFSFSYVGVKGIDGCVYRWDSTNESLIPTHHMLIDGHYYCPYCGEMMLPIQGLIKTRGNYLTTGYCCICQGARDEIEYEQKRAELEEKHRQELYDLENAYHERLQFCTEKLIDIQVQAINKSKSHMRDYSHISTLNDKKYHDIKQILDL